jgi:spermidine/putrescine transport system permease protein
MGLYLINYARRSRSLPAWLLLLPNTLWLLIFFVLPLLVVLAYSFMKRATFGGIVAVLSLENYSRALDPLYFNTLLRSIYIAIVTTVICLVVAYPIAYFIATRPAKRRNLLILLLMLPFWTNFLIRTYAWLTLLRTNTGLINVSLMSLGLIDSPLPLFGNDFAIVLGLVYSWLPTMILPVYASLERLDRGLLEAASDLYASGLQVFRRVIWPLSLPGVAAGSVLVFIPSLGAFVTPTLLGGGKSLMIGNVISDQFLTAQDWPFGAALSMLMITLMLLGTLGYFRLARRNNQQA